MKKLARNVLTVNGEAIGLDVHKDLIVFSRLDRRGDEIACGEFDSTHEALKAFLREHVGRRKTHVALEACGGTLWDYDVLRERLGADRVHVAQSRRIRAIANSQEKNDLNDAWWPAYLTHERRLPECFIPTGDLRELRLATRECQALITLRTRLIVQLRGHLRQMAIRLPNRTLRSEANWAFLRERAQRGPGHLGMAITFTLELIDHIDGNILDWQGRIEALTAELPEVKELRKHIPGVGPIIAATIFAESGPIRRFRSAKAFGRYVGLTPIDRSSGGRVKHGGITRHGSPHLRRALLQAVNICCRCRKGSGAVIRSWIEAKQRRLGNKVKARAAAGRKLAEGIWRLFALGECYDVTKPFGTPRADLAA